jgi:hypothetical protein
MRTTHGRIWFKNPDAYRSRQQQGFNAIRNADGTRAFQEQIAGKMRARKYINQKTLKMATSSVSGIARNTTANGWKKSDLDRLNTFATSIPIRYTGA